MNTYPALIMKKFAVSLALLLILVPLFGCEQQSPEELSTRLAELQQENAALQEELATVQADVSSLQNEYDLQEEKISELETRANSAREFYDDHIAECLWSEILSCDRCRQELIQRIIDRHDRNH